ncbi:hypothetical protein HMPREF0972_02208 [Actinomyces sp. oral taxon 848 str. F0332]|nr:hypothetical protein HMPREF0972_02208 [Actinomyces sp. oral taxon 848 str. F0332]
MGHFVSFPEAEGPERVERLVLNLVDPAVDAGAVGQLISLSLSPLDGGAAALFNSDPLIDYRSQRPLMNYKDGRLVDMRRSGIVLSHASDVEGQPFLHLHGAEPDFQWDALLADMIDIIERFGVKSTFSFTAVPSATPHTRPADMVVRTADKREDQVFEADFWFTASFADYVEFHTAKLGISHTNVAVRVPVYLAGDRYFTGAAGALGLTSSLSGLYFPLGDLEQAAAEEVEAYSSAIEGNEELAQFIDKLEKDYDANGSVRGYVTAPKPELRVPTVDEIGRAAEQFLAGVSSPRASASEKTFDPQGLLRKMERYQGFLPGEPGVGESPAFDVSAMRSHQAGAAAEAPERPADDEGDSRGSAEEAADVATDAQAAESPEGAAESVADPAEGSAVGENEADGADADAEAAESGAGAGVADAFEPEEADIAGPEAPAADAAEVEGEAAAEAEAAVGFESDEDFSTVSEEAGSGSKDVALTDSAAESDVPAEAVDARDRSGVAAGFGDVGVVGGESDPEARGESDPTRGDASNLGDDRSGASKRENQEEALQADVEADNAGEFGSAAGAEESGTGEDGGREAYAVGEADLDGEKDGLREQAEPYGHAGAEELAGTEEAVGVEGGAVEEIADTEDARAFAGVEGAQESVGVEGSQEFADVEDRRELSGIQEARDLNGIESTGKSADNEPGEVLEPDETLEPLSALGRIKAFLKNLPDAPDPSEQNGEPGEVLDPAETLEPLSASGYIDVAAIESSGWSAPEGHVQDFGENGIPGEDAEGAEGDGAILDAADAGSEDQAVGFEAAAAETEANAGLLITESEVIESMMGDSAEQPSNADGAPAESSAERVSVVDGALADSAMAGPPSGAGSAENPEAWERPNELEPPVSFDSAGSFEPAAFDSSDPLESSRAFGGPGTLPAGGEGSPREFEGVSFTTGDGGQAVGYEADGSEEGFIPSGAQGGDVDAWPVRGWDEALGFGRESETVVSQEDANASHSIVFAPHVFGAALSAGDTPRHSALERMQTLVLKDSPEADALAEAASEKAEQEAPAETDGDVPAAGTDGDAPASGEMAPDGAGLTGENPESPGEDEPSDGASNDAAANEIGPAGDGGAAPAISVPNEADPLGGAGADSVPPASLPASNVGQLPEPGQGQVKRRRGKHSA